MQQRSDAPVDVLDASVQVVEGKLLHALGRIRYYNDVPNRETLVEFLQELLGDLKPLQYPKTNSGWSAP